MRYYVNKNAQPNGDHEVHTETCRFVPATQNRLDLGIHTGCQSAVAAARRHYSRVNGCVHCANACHTG